VLLHTALESSQFLSRRSKTARI